MEVFDKKNKFVRAKKRVDELKRFYKHLAFYIIINGFFIGRRIFNDIEHGDPFFEAITDVSNYRLFFWWSLILIFHGFNTYRFNLFFGKDWEKRKIKEEIDKQENR